MDKEGNDFKCLKEIFPQLGDKNNRRHIYLTSYKEAFSVFKKKKYI